MEEVLRGLRAGPLTNPAFMAGGLITLLVFLILNTRKTSGKIALLAGSIYTLAGSIGASCSIHIILFVSGIKAIGEFINKCETNKGLGKDLATGCICFIPIAVLSSLISATGGAANALEITGGTWIAWKIISHSRASRKMAKNSKTSCNGGRMNIAIVVSVIYAFYVGYLNWVPDAYDSASTYIWQVTRAASSGSVLGSNTDVHVSDFMPLGVNAALGVAYLSGGWALCKVFLLVAALSGSLTLSEMIKRSGSSREKSDWESTIGLLICATSPIIFFSVTQLYQEAVTYAALAVMTATHIENAKGDNNMGKAMRNGTIAGACLMIKMYMLYYVIGIAATTWFILAFRRKIKPKEFFVYWACCLSVGSTFYIRSYYLSGNPVFPFYNNIFKSSLYPLTEFKTIYSQPFDIIWPLRMALDNSGRYMEAYLGYVPLTLAILAIAALVIAVMRIYGYISTARLPETVDIIMILGVVVPTGLIVFSQSYSRYASQGILVLSTYSAIELSNVLRQRKTFELGASLAICTNILFLHSANLNITRESTTWEIRSNGLPRIKKETTHRLEEDYQISEIITKNHKKGSRSKILKLRGRSDGFQEYSGLGLENKKYFERISDSWLYPGVSLCSQRISNEGRDDGAETIANKYGAQFVILNKTSQHATKSFINKNLRNEIGETKLHRIFMFSVSRKLLSRPYC